MRTPRSGKHTEKLLAIFEGILEVIDEFKPGFASVEAAYFGKSAQSSMKLGEARGVALLACATRALDVASFAPARIKKALTGNGNASKEQVQYMVMRTLDISSVPEKPDITDALAAAVCLITAPRSARLRGRKP